MTAVELPLYDMGRSGAVLLVDIMNDRPAQDVILLPSEIVIRESL
jgi:DNA-binding LacI/PurR family transcriptional regulator